MVYLRKAYPRLYIYMLELLKMPDEIKSFMKKCAKYSQNPEKYSLYIQGFLLEWLGQQRKAGKLKQGE